MGERQATEGPRGVEAALQAHAADVFAARSTGEHLDDELIERTLSTGRAWTASQVAHLATCAECRDVVALAARSGAPSGTSLAAGSTPWRPLLAWLGAAAAASMVVVAGTRLGLAPALAPEGYAPKGHDQSGDLAPEVTFLATSAEGRRRDLREGDAVGLDERLGFKYGDPSGGHLTLTILGWDGARVHWYYPERAGAEPVALARRAGALAVRLPEDIALGHAHRPGPLTIAAAFDAEPSELAASLRSGGPLPDGATRIRVRVVSPAEVSP